METALSKSMMVYSDEGYEEILNKLTKTELKTFLKVMYLLNNETPNPHRVEGRSRVESAIDLLRNLTMEANFD